MSDVATLGVEAALAQRLRAVSTVLLGEDAPPPDDYGSRDAGSMLDALVRAIGPAPTPDHVWLLCTAVAGSLPRLEDVVVATRFFRLAPPMERMLWILDYALGASMGVSVPPMELELVCDAVVVDVDHTARHDLHTGIQQVVRRTLPLWARDHDVVPVVWTEPAKAMRNLLPDERRRVLHWGEQRRAHSEPDGDPALVLVVPWRSVVVLPEVPFPVACDRLAAVARFSGNEVVAIGYDCIPVLSADMVPAVETNRFVRYLSVIKHARRVACIGATSTAEFRGYAKALSVQGIAGPQVEEVPLPVGGSNASSQGRSETPSRSRLPMVLCVGTFEPRKNQLALLHAAERLWREGLRFELVLIGGAGWGNAFPDAVSRLQHQGRSVRMVKEATAQELDEAYRNARFTVFASLHEGFGLPVAESFEHGTPVITSNFGSTAEIAEDGGAVLVDPFNDGELMAAMRRLLTDDELVEQLRRAIANRRRRTWEEYASELWDSIVAPGLVHTRTARPPS